MSEYVDLRSRALTPTLGSPSTELPRAPNPAATFASAGHRRGTQAGASHRRFCASQRCHTAEFDFGGPPPPQRGRMPTGRGAATGAAPGTRCSIGSEAMRFLRRTLATVLSGRCALALLPVVAAILAMPAVARGDNIFETNNSAGTIGEYTTSGATVNASLVSGLNQPAGIAVSGSNLFVANFLGNTIGEYTTSGATVNASLVSGLKEPAGIAVSGSNLFVTNFLGNTIGEYTTSGATVNASLVTGLS